RLQLFVGRDRKLMGLADVFVNVGHHPVGFLLCLDLLKDAPAHQPEKPEIDQNHDGTNEHGNSPFVREEAAPTAVSAIRPSVFSLPVPSPSGIETQAVLSAFP